MAKSAVITTVPLDHYRLETTFIYLALQVFDPSTGKLGAEWSCRFNIAEAINVAPRINGATLLSLLRHQGVNSDFYVHHQTDAASGRYGMTAFCDFIRQHEITDIWYDANRDNIGALKWVISHYIHDVTLSYVLQSAKFYDYSSPLRLMGGSGQPDPDIRTRNTWAVGIIHQAITALCDKKPIHTIEDDEL